MHARRELTSSLISAEKGVMQMAERFGQGRPQDPAKGRR